MDIGTMVIRQAVADYMDLLRAKKRGGLSPRKAAALERRIKYAEDFFIVADSAQFALCAPLLSGEYVMNKARAIVAAE